MTRILAAACGLLTIAGAARAATDPRTALADIDSLIETALVEQKIPGAVVGVVVGDEVVLLKGYGLRDIEKNLPMTPDTIVPIASVTKQFTVASLGTLVREGKLDWDKPVIDFLPEFRLSDDHATLHVSTRDLVTHRSGVAPYDFAWFGAKTSREELVRRLRHFPVDDELRTRFQYSNFMYMVAGYLAGRVAGTSYEEHVRRSLFEPLAMTRSGFSFADLSRDADHATGYELDNQRALAREEYVSAEAMAPMGGMNSTARDLTRWMRMLLGRGQLEGKRILQARDVAAMLQPNMPVGAATMPEFGFRSYGMGLYIDNYRGHEVASHSGNMPGAAATITIVPRERIGVIVLTNRSRARLRDGLPYEIIDRLLGLAPANLVARYASMDQKSFEGEVAARAAGVTDRKPGTKPSHDLAEYAGRYFDPGYGTIEVRSSNGALVLAFNGFTAPLEHWHYDIFQTPADRTSQLDGIRVQFHTDFQGEISAIGVPMAAIAAPTTFVKQPPAEMMERAFLQRFVGTYEVGGRKREILLGDDGVLRLLMFGTAHELVPVRGTLFRVKTIEGMTVEFLSGPSGAVDRIAFGGGEGSIIGPKTK